MEEPIWLSKYQMIKRLGKGGSGDVFLAKHIKLNDLRAIKRISKANPLHNQLLLEANILKNLSHPCIPWIYDLEEDLEYSYIIESYIKGQSLKEFCEVNKHLSESLILSIGIQICDLLLYLYSLDNPILHLDLQPSNIIIDKETVKLIDFGTAILKEGPDTRTASLGTKNFAPPEAYTKVKPDEKADIYGVGALLYYMISGVSTTHIKNKIQFVKKKENSYSKELKNIIHQCLRYQSIFRIPTVAVLKNKLLKLNRISPKNQISNKSLRISIAGAQNRIGTTHLGFLITSYLDSMHIPSLYVEENDSGHMLYFLETGDKARDMKGRIRIKNCNILPKSYLMPFMNQNPEATIRDYGVLSSENKMDFLSGDIRILLVGGKEWERENKKRAINLLEESKEVIYLYNFLDGYQFSKHIKGIHDKSIYRIPYVPDPFYKAGNDYLDDFLWNLTHL